MTDIALLTACWNLIFLAGNPEWTEKVRAEVKSLIEKHTNTLSSDPLHKRLSAIPISAWEDEMPALDMVIRETLRISQCGHTLLRRNIFADLPISDKVIQKGSFLAYSLADTHLNPEIYSDPLKFDPGRYCEGREEDKKGNLSYLGWGAGELHSIVLALAFCADLACIGRASSLRRYESCEARDENRDCPFLRWIRI